MDAAPAESARYAQIAAELRRRIEARAYPSGELPSAGELSVEFGVARKTVQRALELLDRAGLTAGRPGRPRFVVHGSDDTSRTRYEQVAARLRRDIRTGVLPPGARVPPEPVLAEEHGLSRATVRQGLALLEQTGEIVSRAGRRYVAGSGARSDLAYERVADEIRGAIESGSLAAETRIPGEHELAGRYGVSRPTVRKALAQLEAEGLVRPVPKQGWHVTAARRKRGAR